MAVFEVTHPDNTIHHSTHQEFAAMKMWASVDKTFNGDTELVKLVQVLENMRVEDEVRWDNKLWRRVQ